MDANNYKNDNIKPLLNQLRTNTMIYEEIPLEMFEENDSLLFSRLKTQKNIFIKEVCHVFKIEKQNHFDSNDSQVEKEYEQLIKKHRSELKDKNADKCIALILKIENLLQDNYSNLLLDADMDEITRMILSNQSNEVKRDIRGLKHIQRYNA